jgi:hypothetical protein
MGKRTDVIVSAAFADGTKVTLGGDDELIIEFEDGATSGVLNDDRLALVKRLQDAEDEGV